MAAFASVKPRKALEPLHVLPKWPARVKSEANLDKASKLGRAPYGWVSLQGLRVGKDMPGGLGVFSRLILDIALGT